MNISRVVLIALMTSLAGCAAQSVVAPPAAPPAAAPTSVSAADLVTQTLGRPVANAHASDVELPSLIRMGIVEYPEEAREALISGTVVVLAHVGKDGLPSRCVIESQSYVENGRDDAGNMVPLNAVSSIVRKDGSIVSLADLFDPLAIKAIMQARFNPMKRAGVAKASVVRMPVAFGVVHR